MATTLAPPITARIAFPRSAAGDRTPPRSSLRRIAAKAARDLEEATASEVIRWAADTFGAGFCVTSSMSDGVLAHLAAAAVPGVDVLFVDTGYHFVETLGTRDAVDATLPLHVITAAAPASVREHEEAHGRDLWKTDPDTCCALRKVEPL